MPILTVPIAPVSPLNATIVSDIPSSLSPSLFLVSMLQDNEGFTSRTVSDPRRTPSIRRRRNAHRPNRVDVKAIPSIPLLRSLPR